MNLKISLIILCIVFINKECANSIKKAVTIVPVADLVGCPLKKNKPYQINTWYTNLPYSEVKAARTCKRMHQLLFNEIVDVLQEKDDQVKIAIPNVFFEQENNSKKLNTYWTLKKNLVYLDTLKNSGIPAKIIPSPISFSNNQSLNNKQIVTLIEPFIDKQNDKKYSAGTRFVAQNTNNKKVVSVSVLQKTNNKLIAKYLSIPRSICHIESPQSKKNKIKAFVGILKKWSQPQKGYIPYVLGGSSYTQVYSKNSFKKINGKSGTYYLRNFQKKSPFAGLDCTGLIARAAQICGIPYFYKNTTTVAKYLKPLQGENIEEGDIIWFKGHVLVISDIKHHKVIEARSYDHGFGKIHELPINQVFLNIKHIKDLRLACINKKPLTRLDNNKKPVETIRNFNILKISSVWHA